jgi:hypothetical protein
VDFSLDSTLRSGILILGRYQYIRVRNIQLQTITAQNSKYSLFNPYTVRVGVSMDGQTIQRTIIGTELSDAGIDVKRTGFASAVGRNHTLIFQGAFNLNSLTLEFNNHGRT